MTDKTPVSDGVHPEWDGPIPEPRVNAASIIMIDDEPYKHLGATVPDRIHLMHMSTGLPYLHWGEDGDGGLLTDAGWDELRIAGRLRVLEPPSRIKARQIARMTDWDYRDIVGEHPDEATDARSAKARDDGDGEGEGVVEGDGAADAPPAKRRRKVAGPDLPLDPAAAKMLAQVLLMDEKDVPNGIKAMEKALAKHWPGEFEERFGPHDKPTTIRRWRATRGTPGNRLLVDFVRMWGRVPRKPYDDGVVDQIMHKKVLIGRTDHSAVIDIHDEISTLVKQINDGEHPDHPKPAEPYPEPSYHKVWRAWVRLDNAFTAAARNGKEGSRADWGGSGRPLIAKRPLQLGIIDHTRLENIVVIDLDNDILYEEVWLTTLFDVSARVALGRVVTAFPPSFWTVGEVIRRANLPKRPPPGMAKRYRILRRLMGRSAELIVDNGREFRGHGFESAAGQAGFSVRFAPIKRPTYKAVGERYFRTIKAKVSKLAPGYVIPFPASVKGARDPKIDACLLIDDLEAILNQAEAEYHTEIHDALGMQPALFFQRKTGGFIDVAHDLGAFFNEIEEVVHDVQIDRGGVTQWGMRYFHETRVPELLDDLVPVEPRRQSKRADGTRTAKTKIKFNRMDISRIKVWNRVTRKYVELRCEHADYADGLPLELHLQIARQAEADAEAFNTEAERKAARSRRIQALRAIDRTADAEQKKALAKLLEIPRIRQVTGNIVEVSVEPAYPVTIGDFIPHDVAATTSLDDEINAPRKPIGEEGTTRKRRVPARDRRDAGQARKPKTILSTTPEGDAASSRRSTGGSRRIVGDYE
ncbi:MAG: hypothetical protein ACK4SZ_04020 [Allosphingosinicella sp.]|uniref:hypothetical protein n=1 Tax=Allosphingosinicella sp. TaxID=2823234 RepID=UPI00394668E2